MDKTLFSEKTLFRVVLGFEILTTVLIAAGVLPREYAFSITAVMLIYIARAEIVDSLIIAILSIPFYLALPFSASFDTMANWRIIILVMFLKLVFKKFRTEDQISGIKRIISGIWRLDIEFIKKLLLNKGARLEILALAFAAISFFSLVGSANISVGVKKILFLINIFLIFTIVKNFARNKEIFIKIVKASVLAGIFSLVVGYAQLASILFFSLASFWEFWTRNAIAALYGANLSSLLSYSNTWFSYYPGDIPPTLRMFSVFPDSHSFALFNIILIPFVLALALYYKSAGRVRLNLYARILMILFLLAIIFSGSRGAWVSALIPLVLLLFTRSFNIDININSSLRQFVDQKVKFDLGFSGISIKTRFKNLIRYLSGAKLGVIMSTILLFFILFPVSSVILEQTQKAEWRRLNSQGDFSSFAMYKRLRSIMDLDETSNKGRIEIWRDTFASIKKHPLLGVGIGNFTTVIGKNISAAKKGASAHNLFLDIFAEMGILGLAVFLAIFYEIFGTAISIFKNSADEMYKLFALTFIVYLFWVLGYALFDVVLFNDKVLILFMVSVGSLYGIRRSLSRASE